MLYKNQYKKLYKIFTVVTLLGVYCITKMYHAPVLRHKLISYLYIYRNENGFIYFLINIFIVYHLTAYTVSKVVGFSICEEYLAGYFNRDVRKYLQNIVPEYVLLIYPERFFMCINPFV